MQIADGIQDPCTQRVRMMVMVGGNAADELLMTQIYDLCKPGARGTITVTNDDMPERKVTWRTDGESA